MNRPKPGVNSSQNVVDFSGGRKVPDRVRHLYYALLRRVPRWLIAVVLAVGVISVAIGFVEVISRDPNVLVVATCVFVIGVMSYLIHDYLPTDPRKRKDEEGQP